MSMDSMTSDGEEIPPLRHMLSSGSISRSSPPQQVHRSSHRSSTTEEDISFMDDEMTRLHRDMAEMLAIPMEDSRSPSLTQGRVSSGRKLSDELSDSEDDNSDDPALGELRNDLRNSTENFFIRNTPVRNRQVRRASEYVFLQAIRGKASKRGLASNNSFSHLEPWEKRFGGSMRLVKISSPLLGESGGTVPDATVALGTEGLVGDGTSTLPHDEEDKRGAVQKELPCAGGMDKDSRSDDGGGHLPDDDNAGPVGDPIDTTEANKNICIPAIEPPCTPVEDASSTKSSRVSRFDRTKSPRNRVPHLISVLRELRARSEDATRALEALKTLIVSEVLGSTGMCFEPSPAERVWAKRFEISQDFALQRARSTNSSNDTVRSRGLRGNEKIMPLLLLAMDHLHQITANVTEVLVEERRRASEPELPATEGRSVNQIERPRFRSSSVLLRRRRYPTGHAEPISCGVPRYRIQVGRLLDEVYYEVAITQARSTWTVERRLDEFLELRRSLIATAMQQATAAAKRRRRCRRSPRSQAEVDPRGTADTDIEARVPEIKVAGKSWFENSSIGLMVSGRKREEVLAERQVNLASWLATVLADPQLMSPDLVRFLGGGDGGVVAQPIIEDSIEDATESESDENSESNSSEFEDSESDGLSGSRFASDEEWAFDRQGLSDPSETPVSGHDDPLPVKLGKRTTAHQSETFESVARVSPSSKRVVSLDASGGQSSTTVGNLKSWAMASGERGPLTPNMAETSISPVYNRSKGMDAPSPSSPRPRYNRETSLDSFFRAPT